MPGTQINYLKGTDKFSPKGFLQTARFSVNHFGFLGSFARYLLLRDENRKFVQRGRSAEEKDYRKSFLKKSNKIQQNIPSPHSPFQFVLMAEYLFSLKLGGPMVECGCFKGSSSAKLSLLAERTGRRLYICDSFRGLPEPQSEEESFLEGNRFPNYAFAKGEYKGTLEEVKKNIKKYGCLEVCEFVSGLFQDSLPKLDIRPSFIFIDVDYISSARECLKHLWPRLVPGGYVFTHEATFPKYIAGILDPDWWRQNFKELPPLIIGGGSGLSSIASSIAYFRKPAGKTEVF